MRIKLFSLILLTIIVFPQIFLPYQNKKEEITIFNGTPYKKAKESSLSECTDKAQKFINCDEFRKKLPSQNVKYHGRIMIIDNGISAKQFNKLENDYNVDIVAYLTGDMFKINEIPNIGEGIDSLLDNTDLGYQSNSNHGMAVISAVASILPGVEIVFVDVNGIDGFTSNSIVLWEAIKKSITINKVKVINISYTEPKTTTSDAISVQSIITDIAISQNVYIVSSIGNSGQNGGTFFPIYHPNVYSIGSIDHENRGWWYVYPLNNPYAYWKIDYFSKINYFTGYSQHAKDEVENCRNSNVLPFCSNWGDPGNVATSTDFVMPGNGVPALTPQGPMYLAGTSISAPYAAAAALIAVYAYTKGYIFAGGSNPLITSKMIHSMLINAASRTTHHVKLGFGVIDLKELYSEAYSLGKSQYYPPQPPKYCITPTRCFS